MSPSQHHFETHFQHFFYEFSIKFIFQSLNAIKDSVTDVIAESEFCSEDGAEKLVHGAIEKAADNVTNKINDMEIKGIFHVIFTKI